MKKISLLLTILMAGTVSHISAQIKDNGGEEEPQYRIFQMKDPGSVDRFHWNDSAIWSIISPPTDKASTGGGGIKEKSPDGETPYPSSDGSPSTKPPYRDQEMDQSHTEEPDVLDLTVIPPYVLEQTGSQPRNFELVLTRDSLADQPGVTLKKIGTAGMQVHLASGNSLVSHSSCNLFYVGEEFEKSGKVEKVDEEWIAQEGWDANYAIYAADSQTPLSVQIEGHAALEDMATNRSSFTSFGGNDIRGVFSSERLLGTLTIGSMGIQNQHVYIAASDANIVQGVVFNEAINGRHGILVLNCDNGPEAFLTSHTVKVGALISHSEGAGIVTTRTGSPDWNEIDPLSAEGEDASPEEIMGRILSGDSVTREGILEISGQLGNQPSSKSYSGIICDNISSLHTRGRVSVIMNSPNLTQTLSGANTYTGYTKVLAGRLNMNTAGYNGKVVIQGGLFSTISPNPIIKGLEWSSGGFAINLSSHTPIALQGAVNISTMPEAEDAFVFSQIVAGEYTLFTSSNPSVFANFANKTCEYSSGGRRYDAIFSVTNNSLKVRFVQK